MAETIEVSTVPELETNRARRAARINRPKWQPKQWHPVYEEVVLLDALGYKNTAIAEMKGFTREHISLILNTPQAKVIKQIILKRMEQKREETIDQRLEKITERAMSRVEETMNNDELAAKNPLGVFDRAIVVLKSANKIKDAPQTVNNNTLIVSEESMEKLQKAMSLSDEVKQLHSGMESKVGVERIPVGKSEDAILTP